MNDIDQKGEYVLTNSVLPTLICERGNEKSRN